MIYRVIFKISFTERSFDFRDPDDAINFAYSLITHETNTEDEVYIKLLKEEPCEKESSSEQ